MPHNIIKFPKNRITDEFYGCFIRYSDNVEFRGATLTECLINQKNLFEPEKSFREYMEHLRDRLLFIFGEYYTFSTAEELLEILVSKKLVEVYENVKEEDNVK